MATRHGRGSRRRTSLAALRTGLAGALVGSFLLLALPAAAATVPIIAGGPPVTVDVSTPGDTATLTFDGSAGQRVSLDVSDVTIGTSTCCSTKVSILKPDGKLLVALMLGTNGGFIDATNLPAAGTYSILVDAQSTNIGSATLTLYDVPPDVTATIVPGGAPVDVSTAVPGQNARVTFDGTSGQRISLDVSGVTVGTSVCCSAKVSILKPDGKTLASATVGTNGGFIDTQSLASTGSYTVLVDPQGSATGGATLMLYDVPADATGTIVPGGPDATVTTIVPGQSVRVTFDGVSGQRVSLEINGVSMGTSLCCSVKVSILRASGTLVAGPANVGTLGGFIDTITLPATGSYTILVDPQGSAIGEATLTLYDVPADPVATIVPGGPGVTVSTAVPGQNARLTFNGVSGQRVSLEINGVSMGPSTCCSVKVSILRPNSTVLAGPTSAGTSGGFLDAVVLPTAGTYTILVDPQGGLTGDATFTLYDVPADTAGSILIGGPTATIGTTVPGQNAALSFSGTSGQRISLVVGPACCSTKVSILKPNGAALGPAMTFGSFGGFLDTMTLPTSGTYTIVVDLQGITTGDVTLRLYSVPADVTGTIAFGSSATVTTSVPGQNAVVTFTASAGQRMSLRVGPTCCATKISILKPNSSALISPLTMGTLGGFIDTTVLPNNGTYTILLDPQGAATGSVTLTLYDVPADVTGTIAFGVPTAATTTVPGQNAALTFAGTAGQRVSVTIGPGCCTTKVSILKPDSSVLVSLTSFGVLQGFIDTTVLPTSGTYRIVVDPDGSSTGSTPLTLYDVPADVLDAIDFGSSRTETMTVPGQNARVTFAGSAGQVVSLQLTGVTIGTVLSGTVVSILRPDSLVLASTTVGTNGGFIDSKTLPVTGTYTILVDPQGANTGSITLGLADVPVDVTGSIVAGGAPLTVTTTTSGQNARISFAGVVGQRVSLQVGANCCLAQVSLLNPDASVLTGPATIGTGGGFIDTKTLAQDGTYTILFDPQGAATGSVTLTLNDVPPDPVTTLTPGTSMSLTTTAPGQNAQFTFAGTNGQRVSVKAGPVCCIAAYSVLDPSGNAVVPPVTFGTGGGFIDRMTLTATGTYTIVVNPQGAVTGSATITLYDVPPDVTGTAPLGGAAVTVTTTTPGQNAAVAFTGAQDDGVAVIVGPFNCCSTRVSVLNPDGSTLAGPVAFNPDGGTMVARLPAAGTYTVFVDPQGVGFGDLHLRLAIDNTAPAPPLLSLSESSVDGHVSGATYFYRPSGSGGTFTVTATSSESGLQKMTFAGLGGGFTPTTVVEDRIVPYSQTYSWIPGATYSNALNLVTSYDAVGNGSSTSFVVVPDVDAPTTSDNTAAIGSGWKNTDQFVSLSSSDGFGSGAARSHYTTDGSTPTTSSSQGTAITLSADGVYTVRYFSIDNVGNVEAPKTAGTQIRIDKTNPTAATLGALPAVIKNGQTLTGSGSDALSGLGSVAYYYCSGSSCTPSTLIGTSSTAPSYTVTWSSQPADGTYQVLARAIDVAGNTLNSVKQTVTIDNTPPTTTITAKPANPNNSTSASFSFTASEPATFQCQLDGSAFASCSSPMAYSGLAAGSHTFGVRATDAIGNVGVAATWTWTIDTTPPDTTITSSPANPSNSTSPSFSFSSSESGSTFQCSLDGAAFAGCTSPRAYTGLAAGSHTFQVRATDPAGNLDPIPASYTWTIDTAAPDTTITSSPANPTNSTAASFSFSSTESGTFECRLDAASFASCTSPTAYAGLAAGTHTFQARAIDQAGNVDATPASFTWTIDTTAPNTTITSSPANPTNATSASFSFTSTEGGSTFECQLDGGGYSACTTPKAYPGPLAAGSHTFQVRATDPSGNTDVTPASFTWTIDETAPDTTITASPPNPSNSTAPSFSFSSTEGGSTFACSLDGAAFAACTSPKSYAGLATGSHTFQVRATDPAGNPDPTPASYTWTIDTAAPDTTITASPANPTNSTSASFSFTSSESGSSFECRLDGGAFTSCASPQPYSGLAPGSHTFQVKATDQAGNPDLSPASYTWTIDTAAPDTTITSSPANPTNSTSASFSFTSSESGSTFECQLDGGGFSSCASPQPYSGLAEGSHTFQVRATDPAGNTDPTAASLTWAIDTTAPDTTIASGPADPTNSTSASFNFGSTEGGSTFQCQLDGGGYSSCTSPKAYTGLSEGSHIFQVKATDAAGNVDPTPASSTWTIDTTPPGTTITASPANPTNSPLAGFSFSSSESGSGFQCQLDGGGYLPCASPQTYSGLGEGTHSFQVKATDPAGNTDATPASYGWTVDTSPPDTAIGSAPADPTSATDATFSFSSSESGSSFTCSLDGAAFASCTSPVSYSSLADGSHAFEVKATDAAGNTDATPATRSWTVDTTPPPAPVITSPPDGSTNNSGSFTLAGNAEPSATVEVFEGATSRGTTTASGVGSWAKALISVVDGSHTYTVRATDAAGNLSGASNARTVVVDTSAPNTTIGAGPIGSTASTSAIFSFSADDPAATFECSLDAAAFSSCTSPKTYSGLAEGAHAFDVRATDQAGNTDPTPAIRSWTVDVTAPAAPAITSPPDGSTSNTGSFTVSGTAEPNSVVEIFDGLTSKGTVSATGSGNWSKPFTGVADGSHTYTAIASDTAGNTSAVSNSRTVIVDTTPPNTSVDSGPAASTSQTTATLTFSSNEGGSSFDCRLDGAAFASCTSPVSYSSLADGSHAFEVKATDAAGNTDATPATRSWTVDTTAPGTTVDSGPGDPTNATDASLSFSSSEAGSSFECSLDGSSFVTCSSPADYSGLAEGPHTFDVKATDEVGNTDATPASYAWTVDTSAPDTSIDSGPSDPTTDTSATFAFSSSETGSAFECSLDGSPFAACTSPDVQTALALGAHTFQVRATDPAGNTDQSSASHAWTIA